MPPSRPRPAVDDSRSETSSIFPAKERQGGANSFQTATTKGKRATNNPAAANSASNGRSGLTTHGTAASTTTSGNAAVTETPKIIWPNFSIPVLQNYRHSYNLSTPSAYTNPHAHHILSYGIGSRSPSSIASKRATRAAARKTTGATTNGVSKDKDRLIGKVPKEQLANNVRKHFNNLAVSEGEVLARFRYVVRMGGLPDTVHKPRQGTGLGGVSPGMGEREFRLRFHP